LTEIWILNPERFISPSPPECQFKISEIQEGLEYFLFLCPGEITLSSPQSSDTLTSKARGDRSSVSPFIDRLDMDPQLLGELTIREPSRLSPFMDQISDHHRPSR
jgi:hypothetical protein